MPSFLQAYIRRFLYLSIGTVKSVSLFDKLGMLNAASGLAVSDECKLKFMELKAKRNHRYIVFKIDGQQVVVEKVGGQSKSHEDLVNSLPPNECRYAIFDYENVLKSKIIFISWSPETGRVRSKMLYARTDVFSQIV